MALGKAPIATRPLLACLGVIKQVGSANQKEESLFHSLPIEIAGIGASPDSRWYFVFQPRWFQEGFDPSSLQEEDKVLKEAGQKAGQAFVYARNIAYGNPKKPGALEAILGDQFPDFADMFSRIEPADVTAELIEQALREALVGQEVGYILKQSTDEGGNLTERYSVDVIFPATEEAKKAMVESAASPRRKTPMTVLWNEETPF